MTFQDISVDAAVVGDSRWYTGVTMVDINTDGWLDIYVSVSGSGDNTQNQLFINNGPSTDAGQVTFTEMAVEYGIADKSTSIQATFYRQRIVSRDMIDFSVRSHLAEKLRIRHAGEPAGVPLIRAIGLVPQGFVQVLLEKPVLLIGSVAAHPVLPRRVVLRLLKRIMPGHLILLSVPV
jgi:hypothetical protein